MVSHFEDAAPDDRLELGCNPLQNYLDADCEPVRSPARRDVPVVPEQDGFPDSVRDGFLDSFRDGSPDSFRDGSPDSFRDGFLGSFRDGCPG